MKAVGKRTPGTPSEGYESAISSKRVAEGQTGDRLASTRGYSAVEWGPLVAQIKAGDDAGMDQFYKLFNRAIRYYLSRQLGPQELEDKVHDTFLIVLSAIRRGDLREPERLMGFVRTVVRRQVAAYVEHAVQSRREQADLDAGITVADRRQEPEQEAIARQRAELMESVLAALGYRDREILVRFYLKDQPLETICREMGLTRAQFLLLKSRARAKFGEIGKKKLAASGTLFGRQQSVVGGDAYLVPGLDYSTRRTADIEPAASEKHLFLVETERATEDPRDESLPPRVSSLIEDPVVHVLMAASAAFQTFERGRTWLFAPNQSLGGMPPVSMIDTELGRQKVINELGLIEHGMF